MHAHTPDAYPHALRGYQGWDNDYDLFLALFSSLPCVQFNAHLIVEL